MRDKTTKQIFIALGIVALIFVVGAGVLFGIVFYFSTSKDATDDTEAKRAAGREFGKTTDQRGCMQEGLARAKKINLFSIGPDLSNRAFVEECLKSTRLTPGFCNGVPSIVVSAFSEWPKEQCKIAHMDEVQTGCRSVFKEQVAFCRRSSVGTNFTSVH